MREGIQILTETGVAAYQTPEQAIRAFMTLTTYARNLRILYETPRDIPLEFNIEGQQAKSLLTNHIPATGEVLPEEQSKRFLEACGIPVTLPRIATSAAEAVTHASLMGYPVVMKIHSPDITHKSDVGGVMLNLDDEKMDRHAWDHMMQKVKNLMPEARVEGVGIQKMAVSKEGLELIVGIKKDPVFGTVISLIVAIFAKRAPQVPPLQTPAAA